MSHGYIMKKVELRMNKKEKYEVIKELIDQNGNKNRASKKLGISRRQIYCLIIKYKENGKEGFAHGNKTRKPINAFDTSKILYYFIRINTMILILITSKSF